MTRARAEGRVLVTGITGQDGSYLAEQLLDAGFEVHGATRGDPDAARATANLRTVAQHAQAQRLTLHQLRLDDAAAVHELVRAIAPDRCFHLAAESYDGAPHAGTVAGTMASTMASTMGVNVSSTFALLEAITAHAPRARFLLAGSAAQLAGASMSPQNEDSPPTPRTPYALSKALATDTVRWFRAQRGLHACTALLYNHESPRRGERFVSKKIAVAAARAAAGMDTALVLGDLDARRDWGYAPEYVEGMRAMLEHPEPRDLVLATGVLHTVREMAEMAFAAVGKDALAHITVDETLRRGPEPVALVGDARRARDLLGWSARTPLRTTIERMVEAEQRALASAPTSAPSTS